MSQEKKTCLLIGDIHILYIYFSLIYWNQFQKFVITFLSAMSIEKNININQIKCKYLVIVRLKSTHYCSCICLTKLSYITWFFLLGPKSCKKFTLVFGNQIPIRSNEIQLPWHCVCDWSGRTCIAHQLSSFSTTAWWNNLQDLYF